MFGRRNQEETSPSSTRPAPQAPAAPRAAAPSPPPPPAAAGLAAPLAQSGRQREAGRAGEGGVLAHPDGLLERIDASAAAKLSREELQRQIAELIAEIVAEEKLSVTSREQQELTVNLVDDMIGFGPLEPLLADESVNDIMVNGPHQVYVERKGKLELTEIRFRDNAHVMNIAQRIVTRVGRRVDETCPIADARLPDGSRVNVIAPPLAIDGCSISIRVLQEEHHARCHGPAAQHGRGSRQGPQDRGGMPAQRRDLRRYRFR